MAGEVGVLIYKPSPISLLDVKQKATDQHKEPPSLYPRTVEDAAITAAAAAAAPVPDLYPTYEPPSPGQAAVPLYQPQQQSQQAVAASSSYLPAEMVAGMHNNVHQAVYAQHVTSSTGRAQPQHQQQYQQQQQQQSSFAGNGVLPGGGEGMGEGRPNGGGRVEEYNLHTNSVGTSWRAEGEEKWEGERPAFVDSDAPVNSLGAQESFSKGGGKDDTGKIVAGPGDSEEGIPAMPYQDLWAAFLFITHLAVIFWMAFDWGLPLLKKDVDGRDNASQVCSKRR